MKKMILTTLVLIICLGAWASYVITYPDTVQKAGAQTASTPTPTPVEDKTKPISPKMKANVFSQGSDAVNEIALTFDDGPSPTYTAQILDILQRYQIKATFFCIGQQVQEFPALVQQEFQDGEIVGNHTWSHPDLTTLSVQDINSQMQMTSNQIKNATGITPVLFRPPYGAIDDKVKEQSDGLNMTPVLWSIDTTDWQMPGVDAIVNNVVSNVGNGSIILMHDGGGDRSQTIAALPRIITALQQRGFRIVTIPELMADAGE
ncbi:polysaccharide deacetylase family protein [Ktedonospora formicarum]|uniref:Oligosaccharide deacetylase n=1 Tax=Ktedonospora formicarum TaxID=2778364 RepID=A0A8J3I5W4_9CHLR|nr:polysaccharide deacetylase family protein [Ktedonospora formicarum]GHO50912.1 oligosaccharide deacetylase [Ktedonospora formicarum]